MNWSFLWFVGEPWFVVPWYAVGALGALYVIYDLRVNNTPIKRAIGWGWPIIVFFFSVIGLALYFLTARAPGIGKISDEEEKQRRHNQYEESTLRRVNGAVIHCVAGDGFGIMTGMVIARASGLNFWQEFWFEYLVGYFIGWFIFQRKSMEMMSDKLPMQLVMAFRAEFFSMLTVMGGMGAVMTYVTPSVATSQPAPLTAAFWGFGMLGLLVGYVFTFPMNWMMLKIGWKHGMGGKEGAKKKEVHGTGPRFGLVSAMIVLGCIALLIPAWLTEAREHRSIAPPIASDATLYGFAGAASEPAHGPAMYEGIQTAIDVALDGLNDENRTKASVAMDAAMRAAEVGTFSAPGSFYSTLEQIRWARLSLQQGDDQGSRRHLDLAKSVMRPAATLTPAVLEVRHYLGATALSPTGEVVGEVIETSPDSLTIAIGGWRNTWGFIDLGAKREITLSTRDVAFGPVNRVGYTFVAIPSEQLAQTPQ